MSRHKHVWETHERTEGKVREICAGGDEPCFETRERDMTRDERSEFESWRSEMHRLDAEGVSRVV